MRPNYEEMTNKELIAYALAHREDVEPLRVLYSVALRTQKQHGMDQWLLDLSKNDF